MRRVDLGNNLRTGTPPTSAWRGVMISTMMIDDDTEQTDELGSFEFVERCE